MNFSYKARTKEGKIKTGIIEASSREVALEVLHRNELFPTSVVQIKEKKGIQKEIKLFSGVSEKEIVAFSRQLAVMIDSNVPPAEAIEALSLQSKNPNFREKIYKIACDLREGTPLSRALSRHPRVFSSFYVNMVKSGEVSGNLSGVLERVADHVEREYYLRSKTMSAMIYPAVILAVFIIIFFAIVFFVIPQMVDVLVGAGEELPVLTKIVIGVSDFCIAYWWLIVGVLIAGIIFFVFYPKTSEGKEMFDSLSLKVPILGGFLKNTYLSRFAENLSTLISAGIPIAQALEVTADLVGNNVYSRIILQTRERVIKGESISSVLDRYPQLIPPLFVQMASVGERTGRLSSTLLNIVQFYRKEIDTFVNTLSSIIEPVLIIGLAAMVGILAAAVFLPLYQMGGAMV